jgi:hypothetical protein
MNATSSSGPSATSLLQLLDGSSSAEEIEAYLNALAYPERLAQVQAVRGGHVGRLYAAVAKANPVTLDDIVPASAKTNEPIIWEGRNSLPMFSSFQKRFMRIESGLLIGYNHQAMAFVTGPGYFVVKAPNGVPPRPTELYFDYTEAPPIEATGRAGWPTFKPNERGLSRAVYAHMHDYMRRVARGVIVGSAFKKGVEQPQFFSLTRQA